MKGTTEEARAIIEAVANADIEDGERVGEMSVRFGPGKGSQWLHVAAKEWLEAHEKREKNADHPECVWTEDRFGCFHPECADNEACGMLQGGPKANGFEFCPFCGRVVVEKPYKEDSDGTD